MGAYCTHSLAVLPPDAVEGQHRPIVLDWGQRHMGFGDPCTCKSLPVPCVWKYRAEDNPGRQAMGPAPLVAHHQPATKLGMVPCKRTHGMALVLDTAFDKAVLE